jgi:hypothetical protein
MKFGFGMSLIEQSAKGEGGSAEPSVETEGISWEITLPLPRTAANFSSLVSSESETLGAPITHKQTSIAKAQTAGLAGKRFLIVEDEPLIALLRAGELTASVRQDGDARQAFQPATAARSSRLLVKNARAVVKLRD